MFGSHAKRHRKNHPGMFASGFANPRAAVAAAPATSGAASEAAATTSPIDYVPADAEAPASLARHLNQTVAVAASGPVSDAASTASLTGSFPAGAVVPELLARHWNQTFHGRNRQAKAAAALLQSTAAAAATASVATFSAPNGVTGIGGLVSTLTGIRRADVGSGSFAAAAASAGRNARASFFGTVNPLVRSAVQESASAASASRSSSSSSSSSSLPGFLSPPGYKRFALTDSRGKYLPLTKDYATGSTRGQRAPVLDLDAPPGCCPFDVYTQEDREREYRKEQRRREERKEAEDADAEEAAEEPVDLNAVYRREMARKRARESRSGFCELCGTGFKHLGEHLKSERHVSNATNPANFECIDAMAARHKEILIERAIKEEVNHHILKLFMLKNPEKFAELDWVFPKLARWVELRRQAEHNVAERDRLAAATTVEQLAATAAELPAETAPEIVAEEEMDCDSSL